MITVRGLYTYPVKALGGIYHREIEVGRRGLAGDRLWMVTRDDGGRPGVMVTQRDIGFNKLAAVSVDADALSGALRLNAPGIEPVTVARDQCAAEPTVVQVWKDNCMACDAGPTAAEWLSRFTGEAVRLVRIADDFRRSVADAGPDDEVGFADGSPLNIANTSSLAALHAAQPDSAHIPMKRFRPNIVLDGLAPFEEDVIGQARIGAITVEFTTPCVRCKVPTIDQQTGEVDQGRQPLRALAATRKGKGGGLQGTFFSVDALPRSFGTVRVGDRVEILSRRTPHPAVADAVLRFQP